VNSLTDVPLTRTISFDGMGQMNGQRYDMNTIAFTVPFNQVEKWRFTTGGNGPHPVHIHGASFQVVNRSGGRNQVYPHERGWKDVVLLNDGETVDVLIKFDASNYYSTPSNLMKGVYVIHCHKLEHEDNGMMMNFKVVGP
jgi:FtsP/CotA-like multicopper oxidase with cupredoxin domain